MAYGDSLASEMRVDGDYPVVGSGGISGSHLSSNFRAPGIVVGRKGSYGSVHWLPLGGFAIDTAYYIDERLTSADLGWLYYVLQAVDLKGPSQDVGVPGLAREAAYEVPVPEPPPLEEQRRIADFLDAETSRLDDLVGLRQVQFELIGERLAAKSAHLTGRIGIRSGVTCGVAQLRRAVSAVRTGFTPALLEDRSEDLASCSSLPWYTPAAVDGWMRLGPAGKMAHRAQGIAVFPKGSVLVTGIGESLGKVAYLDHVATGNQQLTAITPEIGVNGRFIAWQLWAAEREIREWAQYSRIRIINNDSLKSFPIHLPGRAVQDAVVLALDSQMGRARQLEDANHRFKRLAAERRQALITAAVTGQFDVSTASGRNTTEGITA
ncbi:restriction endonuclease subunit S [Streptomyces sanyensis]|uniref:restriction endonuclease subunit S n=1 Tax=Streptomyces sanyensis TaxID=568869 RepID=UPI003D781D98